MSNVLRKIAIIVLAIILSPGFIHAQNLQVVGIVLNKETKEPLPFATIGIAGTSLGTVANESGKFKLTLPDSLNQPSLVVNYVGYETETISYFDGSEITILLAENVVQLETVVVRPVSPEEYIRQAMSKREENYGDSFQAYAYFQQLTKDNGDPFKYMEGYCQTYAPDFLDTMQLQQRLLLFEEADDLKEMDFGKKKSAKKFAKAKKRAEKSGEEFDEEKAREEARAVMVGMMAPADVIEMDPLRNLEGYINPEKLDEYEYAFENNSTYQGREMIVIRFESNGKVRPSEYFPKGRQSGLLFFDKESQALAAVQQDFTMVIPAAIRPILFLAGYGISNPEMKSQVNYQYHQGKWYPLSTRFNMLVDLTKKNLFSKNERSKVDAKILVSFDSWQTEGIAEIPEDKRISRDKKLEEQVYALPGIAWDNVNRIPFDN